MDTGECVNGNKECDFRIAEISKLIVIHDGNRGRSVRDGFPLTFSATSLTARRLPAVPLIDFPGNFLTFFCQVEKTIIYGQKSAISQDAYCMADTRLRKFHVPGKAGRSHRTFSHLLLQYPASR